MPETIRTEYRKAKKEHVCDYCGEKIMPGEEYLLLLVRHDGRTYNWTSHESCRAVALRLNVDGDLVSEYGFQNKCFRFCRENICGDCEDWNGFYGDCEDAKDFCTDKIYMKLFGEPK